ncbi:MAG: isoleucine--tRNA ligase [Dehalococcoidia bacterium]|nr:isoleucine--tRNA ligase [Dehalococcoidia bacterium]
MFQPVSSKVDFPAQEERILNFWKTGKIFEKSVDQRQGADPFILYEGPPTANGNPGIHHVLARVFKDIMPRYKAMKGFYAPRRAGWDTHGLPVELEVEKTLGFSSKTQIEEYGVEKFNKHCRDSVFKYLDKWIELTERIGFWVDLENPYVTLKNEYIETGWWIIKNLWDKKLLYQGFRVTPHCPRCGTSLSSHEVALGYKDDADDPSVFIKFKLDLSKQGGSNKVREALYSEAPTYFLVWTTTPWTLPGNTALAIAPDADYAVVEYRNEQDQTERIIMAQALLKSVIKQEYSLKATLKGSDLAGFRYEPLFEPKTYGVDVLQFTEGHIASLVLRSQSPETFETRVISGDFVSLTDGTGIVHMAPAFGEVDYEAGKKESLFFVQPVDLQGKMTGTYPFAGKFVKVADKDIIGILKARNLLFRSERIKHTYPFCWRCNSPLLYYAKPSWYIRTSAKKQELIDGNQKINWYPEHIKEGRFGDWLRNNVDWALSRERYWGTPLPVWRCQNQACHHEECIGSREELKSKPGLQGWSEDLDLHRPYIDQVTYSCPKCGGTMRRVTEVLDCWFDSGAMPFAQWHYPLFKSDVNERYKIKDMDGFNQWFPADYICEAVDQTRGWFYTLHALSTLVKGEPCYKNVICLGLILDAKGEKMSKARGNVVDPWKVIKERGADALRWYMLTASSPGNVRRFDPNQVTEVQRQFLLTLWNTYSFFVTYALIDKYNPATATVPEPQGRPELDRWILSELNSLIQQVTERLDNYDPTTAGRAIADFVDNLSNWYVRRSRRRFWKSENDADKLAAYATLYECLVTLCKLLAPFTPFMAEEIYRNLVRSVYPEAPESVHLADYPVANIALVDEELSANTRAITSICSLGRAARSVAGIKVRQPIKEVCITVISGKEPQNVEVMSEQIRDELNVKEVIFTLDKEKTVSFEIKPNLPLLGPKYGNRLAQILNAIKRATPAEHVKMATLKMGRAEIPLNEFILQPDELILEIKDKPGYKSALDVNYIVSISTEISPVLKAEGLSREIVHRIQTMRRSAGFDIADYIITYYVGIDSVEQIMQDQELVAYIRQETLSKELKRGVPLDAYTEKHKLDGMEITLGVKKYI